MNATTHPLVDTYLRRLDQAARTLPRGEREELVRAIRDDLDSRLSPAATDVDVMNALDELGEPAEIVRAARPDALPRPARGAREVLAVLFLVVGGLVRLPRRPPVPRRTGRRADPRRRVPVCRRRQERRRALSPSRGR